MNYTTQPNTESQILGIVSLVCGILSFLIGLGPLASIPGIITGHMARSRNPNDGLALGGLILSYLNLVAMLIFLVIILIFGIGFFGLFFSAAAL